MAIGRAHAIRSIYVLDFREMVDSPDFKVKKAIETTLDGKSLFDITFEYQRTNPSPEQKLLAKSYSGTVQFAPDSYWAMTEGTVNVDGGDKLLGGYQIKNRLANAFKGIPRGRRGQFS